MPLPVKGTTAGETSAELELTVSVPVRLPVTEGRNSTPTVQFDPAARVVAQALFTKRKSPVAEIVNPASAADPVLVTVKLCIAEVAPTVTLPKVICVGAVWMPPTARPLPARGITSGATPRLLTVAVSAPGWLPLAVGVKLIATAQEVLAGSLVVHVVRVGTMAYGPVTASARVLPV